MSSQNRATFARLIATAATGSDAYTGPIYHTINPRSEREWDVIEQPSGKRIGTYMSVDQARRIVKNADDLAMKEYLKAQRKARKKGEPR